jgi:hypothetical protein
MNGRHVIRTLGLIGLGALVGGMLVISWLGHSRAGMALESTAAAAETLAAVQVPSGQAPSIRGWEKGKGWGWIWGKDDEVGALNGLSNETRGSALKLATRGEVFDLGMTYSRRSFKWPGHSPGEIITFRSPDGVARMQDADAPRPCLLALGRHVHLG